MRSQNRRKTFTWLYLIIFRLCKEEDLNLEKRADNNAIFF